MFYCFSFIVVPPFLGFFKLEKLTKPAAGAALGKMGTPISGKSGIRHVFDTNSPPIFFFFFDHAAAVRRLPLVRISKCFDRRIHRLRMDPSAKPFRDSDQREPPNSRRMVPPSDPDFPKIGVDFCQRGAAFIF